MRARSAGERLPLSRCVRDLAALAALGAGLRLVAGDVPAASGLVVAALLLAAMRGRVRAGVECRWIYAATGRCPAGGRGA